MIISETIGSNSTSTSSTKSSTENGSKASDGKNHPDSSNSERENSVDTRVSSFKEIVFFIGEKCLLSSHLIIIVFKIF